MDSNPYVPWRWTVQPADPDAVTCPTPAQILSTFAAVNAVVACFSVVFGNRLVVQKLSFGLFGKRESNSWMYMWVVSIGLQLGANAMIAVLIKRTPGYEHGFSIGQLLLFFCVRPRISWIFSMIFAEFYRKDKVENTPSRPGLSRRYDHQYYSKYYQDYIWRSAALTQLICELILQLIAAYSMGKTVHFAASRGYYLHGRVVGPSANDALMMYGAALAWLLLFPQIIVSAIQVYHSFNVLWDGKDAATKRSGLVRIGWIFVPTMWVINWVFLAGYVRLAGDSYCPPHLKVQGIIWAVTSSLGITFGTGI